LERGDQGINPLDEACKEHYNAYSQNKALSDKDWSRVKAPDIAVLVKKQKHTLLQI